MYFKAIKSVEVSLCKFGSLRLNWALLIIGYLLAWFFDWNESVMLCLFQMSDLRVLTFFTAVSLVFDCLYVLGRRIRSWLKFRGTLQFIKNLCLRLRSEIIDFDKYISVKFALLKEWWVTAVRWKHCAIAIGAQDFHLLFLFKGQPLYWRIRWMLVKVRLLISALNGCSSRMWCSCIYLSLTAFLEAVLNHHILFKIVLGFKLIACT